MKRFILRSMHSDEMQQKNNAFAFTEVNCKKEDKNATTL